MKGRELEMAAVVLIFVLGQALGFRSAALRRSTIPVALDHVVLGKDLQFEKKPPLDDACRLLLDPVAGGARLVLRVDHAVFDAVEQGDRVTKAAGDERLNVADRRLQLVPSGDAEGARWPLGLALLTGLVAMSTIAGRRRARLAAEAP